MKFRKLGQSDLNLSVITLGTWGMGGDFWGKADDAQSIATIQAALDAGITSIDTAPAELNKLREEGKARYIGVSNFSPEQMDEAAKYCPIVSAQPPYSLLKREIEKDVLPYCIEHDMGVLSYGSIGAGALTGKFKERPTFEDGDKRGEFYEFFNEQNWPKTKAMIDTLEEIASSHGKPTVHAAINWVLKQKGITVALVGARTPE